MKKSFRKITSLFLAIAMVTALAAPAMAVSSTTEDHGYYSITTYGSTVTYQITDWKSMPEDVVVPDGVTTIFQMAFNNKPQLKTVTIPTSVTSFGRAVFGSTVTTNSYLPTDIYYKGTEVQWHKITNSDQVPYGITIHYTGVTDNSQFLTIENGVLTKCDTAASGALVIPDGVTSIGEKAFYNCKYITSVTIPEGVTSIGCYAFGECSKIASVTLPATLRNIGASAFSGCRSLNNVAVPMGVTRIEGGTFGWTAMSTISIPRSVTFISGTAFTYTTVKDIYFGGTEAQWEAAVDSYSYNVADATVHYNSDVNGANNGADVGNVPNKSVSNGTATGVKLPFTDVAAKSYYYNAVCWAVSKGITDGTSKTTFSPDDTCITSEILTFLYRAAGSPSHNNQNSVAVWDKSLYYYNSVCWADENGLIRNSTFRINRQCTRADVLIYMWRAAGSPWVENTTAFTDLPVGEATTAIAWAYSNGITDGTSKTKFSPNDTVTRAQAVTFIYRSYLS